MSGQGHPRKGKVLVAMSGGVDSSVAAALLVREGFEVVGCFMRLGSPGETLDEMMEAGACEVGQSGVGRAGVGRAQAGTPAPPPSQEHDSRGLKIGHQGCCSIADAGDARLVAAGLGIPFYVCNFKKDFGRIIDYFVDEYASGRTPNPCVRCNDWLKFGKLHEYARQVGAEFVASGHYARIGRGADGSLRLLRGVDGSKDQSYVLFGAPRERLSSMMFPIGEFPKHRVREMAREMGLQVFDKPDSQEICFVPDNDYAGLVERKRPDLRDAPGQILDREGRVVGEHRGQHHYTIGQRRGLSVSLGHRIYVVSKDAATNTVVVGEDADLRAASCVVGEANWLADAPKPGVWREVLAKYRYNTPAAPARVRIAEDGVRATASGRLGRFDVEFVEPQVAVAPGQALVLYDASEPDWVVGGGWIEDVRR